MCETNQISSYLLCKTKKLVKFKYLKLFNLLWIQPILNMENEVGKVSSYFSHVSVAAIKLSGVLKVGDKVHFKGTTTDFLQKISSMQVEKDEVKEGKNGD